MYLDEEGRVEHILHRLFKGLGVDDKLIVAHRHTDVSEVLAQFMVDLVHLDGRRLLLLHL